MSESGNFHVQSFFLQPEAERGYVEPSLVAHRKSLAYTGRDLTKQIVADLASLPDLILEKVDGLRKIGVEHACALEWFAKVALQLAGPRASRPAHALSDRELPARS